MSGELYIDIGCVHLAHEYVLDRVKWLYDHREMIGGLRFTHEPKSLRFFTGLLEPVSDWPEKLVEAYIADFGEDQ